MKKTILLSSLTLAFALNLSFASPQISFEELMILSEENPQTEINSKVLSINLGNPVSIISAQKIIADVKGTENGKPVYIVITDFLNPYNGGYTAFYEELKSRIDFSNSRIDFGNGRITDNTGGVFNPVLSHLSAASKFIMVTDSGNDRVYILDAQNGNLIDTAFIPQTRPQFNLPKNAIQHFNGIDILVADQNNDVVQLINNNGTYNIVFAPIGGPITSILDNIRGISYRRDANDRLLVSVGAGTSINTIQQFDAAGNSLGSFIAGNINSPFDVLTRNSDVLISNFSGTNRISRFDQNGSYIGSLYTGAQFAAPEQLIELPNGFIAAAAFSPPSGIAVLNANGTFVKLINTVTGNRGIYLLGNGHYVTTNGTGVHEIDSGNGSLVRTIVSGTSFQYIDEYRTPTPQLRLTINFEACNSQDTVVVQIRRAVSPYGFIESITGLGGQSVPYVFNYSSPVNGTPYYIVVMNRNSIATWSANANSFISNYLNYNFTFAASQAFGNNMIDVSGKWSFYTGDINQDGSVNLTDIVEIYNDGSNFVTGYNVTDLNCDFVTDLTDLIVGSNNSQTFISVIAP